MFRSPHFVTKELVPPEEYKRWGDGALMLMSPLLVLTVHTLRKRHGRFIINSTGRDREQSGLRTVEYYRREYPNWTEEQCLKALAESRSAHLRGDAADLIPLDTTLEAIHQDIKDNPDVYPFLHFVETGVTWLHVDVRNQPHITFWNVKDGSTEVIRQKPIEWNLLVPELTESDMVYLQKQY